MFVAAGFNRGSASARILHQVRSGQLRMVWSEQTRRETRAILTRIPPLSWASVADLFREQDRYTGATDPDRFDHVADPDDRKFAALAEASGGVLLTNDRHLLDERDRVAVSILTPREYCLKYRPGDEAPESDS